MEILRKTSALRIQKQTDGMDAAEVRDISLSGVPLLPELVQPFTNLVHLTLVFLKPRLTTLVTIPLESFPKLRLLDVSDNAITVPEAPTQAPCPNLVRLLLPNNAVSSLAEVQRLAASFPGLEVLDLADNAVDTPTAFDEIFQSFPKLSALNAKDRSGAEVVVEDSDDDDSSDSDSEEYSDDSSGSDNDHGSEDCEALSEGAEDSGDEDVRKRARTE